MQKFRFKTVLDNFHMYYRSIPGIGSHL